MEFKRQSGSFPCCGREPSVSDPESVRRGVAGEYDRYVRETSNEKPGSFAQIAGYSVEDIRSLPQAAVSNALSCGDPVRFSTMRPGDVVLDLGCGAGIDLILAARKVGSSGRVIGVDLSREMLAIASANVRDANLSNVQLFSSEMEFLPLDSSSVDWIISNCALNLSPEKHRVMAEMVRVLKPGGRIYISDVVTDALPEWVRQLAWNFITCIGLAISENEYRDLLEQNGFHNVRAVRRFVYGEDEIRRLLEHEYQEIKESFSAEDITKIVSTVQGRIVKIDWEAERGSGAECRVVAFERKAVDRRYCDLLCYLVSNTIAGEIMGADNYTCMAGATRNFDEKKAFVEDAIHELRHVEMLAGIAKRFDFPVEKRIVEPQWKNVHSYVKTAADRGDIVTCRIIQDLMAESQALVLYRFLSGFQSEVDAVTSGVARTILAEETAHLEAGIDAIRACVMRDREATHDKLIWAHHRVMPEFFSLIRYGCESLCGVLGLECNALDLDAFKADLDELRVNALESYVETLEKCRFDSTVVASLIAGMASWQPPAEDANLCGTRSSSPTGRCCG